MSVELPTRSITEGPSLQRISNEVGNEISNVLKPRLFNHLVKGYLLPIDIGLRIKDGKFAGYYHFREESFLRDDHKVTLTMHPQDGLFGDIRVIKKKSKREIHIGLTEPIMGRIKLVGDDTGEKWRLDKTEGNDDLLDHHELDYFNSLEYLEDQEAADILVYISGLLKDVDKDLKENATNHLLSYPG